MKTQIIYEDNEILVCFKPAGLAVQSGRASEADMVSELKNYLARSKADNFVLSVSKAGASVRCGLPASKKPVYLGVIHRLDQPVSGLLVFAKTQRAAADLSRQVADHGVCKIYRAVVMASRELENGPQKMSDYMVKEPGGGARIASKGENGAKEGRLTWHCLEQKEGRALVEVALETGRHHQIRLQMSHAGMPLLGDNRYGNEESQALSRQLGIRMVQLQAVKLEFIHPVTKKKVCYELDKKMELC